jgi:HemY protein
MKQRQRAQRQRRSEEALGEGVLDLLEGKWDKAERTLIRHAADSGIPLINYLLAARAAHFRGATDQREDYFERALRAAPNAALAVGLLRARLQQETSEHLDALEGLNEINQTHANHPRVLRMLRTSYEAVMDEEALHYLIPALREAKLYPENDLQALERQVLGRLLEKRALSKDAQLLREVWRWVPSGLDSEEELVLPYCRGMIAAGAGGEVEEPLRLALGRSWSSRLLALYGDIEVSEPEKQLLVLQEWLGPHRDDPDLHGLLARVALKAGHPERAQRYAQMGLELAPNPEALKVLGDLFFQRREDVAAGRLYRQALRLERGEPMESDLVASVLSLLEASSSPPTTAPSPVDG